MGSARSSPMAWEHPSTSEQLLHHEGGHTEHHSLAAAAFDAALSMDTGGMSSGSSERSSDGGEPPARGTSRSGSRSSQRGLQAEVAALQQQLQLAAAMQVHMQPLHISHTHRFIAQLHALCLANHVFPGMLLPPALFLVCSQGHADILKLKVLRIQAEQEREMVLLRAEGGVEEVQAAVKVATAAAQREVAALQRHCAELQSRLVRHTCSVKGPHTDNGVVSKVECPDCGTLHEELMLG